MGERILKLREMFKMSQESFGEKLGITRAAVSKIELGKSNLTESNIKLICREFGVSEEWLRTGEGDMFPVLTEEERIADLLGTFLHQNIDKEDKLKMAIATLVLELLTEGTEEDWKPVKKMIKKLAAAIDEDE